MPLSFDPLFATRRTGAFGDGGSFGEGTGRGTCGSGLGCVGGTGCVGCMTAGVHRTYRREERRLQHVEVKRDRMYRVPSTSLVLVLLLACDGCRERDREREPGEATLTGAPMSSPMARDAVVTQVAHANCLREERCGHVGPTRRYGDARACLARFAPETRQALAEAECAEGISSRALDDCLRTTRTAPCDDLMGDIRRLDACSARDLCAR